LVADLANALGVTSDRVVNGLVKEKRTILMLDFREGAGLQSAYFIAREDVLPAVRRAITDPVKIELIRQMVNTG
jgi:hypothetical protein